MANPVPSSFTVDQYSLNTISKKQQKALLVYAKALITKALGGPDYTATLDSTLFADAQQACIGLDAARRDAARVKVWFNFATTVTATFPGPISDKIAQIRRLEEIPVNDLENMDLYLDAYISQVA